MRGGGRLAADLGFSASRSVCSMIVSEGNTVKLRVAASVLEGLYSENYNIVFYYFYLLFLLFIISIIYML